MKYGGPRDGGEGVYKVTLLSSGTIDERFILYMML